MELMPSHFLGLISIPEIRDFHPPTCDTSMPIKLAMKGMMLRDWAAKDYPHIYTHELGNQGEDYFNAKLTTEQLEQARIFGRKTSTVHDKELARKFRQAGGKNSGLFWRVHLITDKTPKMSPGV